MKVLPISIRDYFEAMQINAIDYEMFPVHIYARKIAEHESILESLAQKAPANTEAILEVRISVGGNQYASGVAHAFGVAIITREAYLAGKEGLNDQFRE